MKVFLALSSILVLGACASIQPEAPEIHVKEELDLPDQEVSLVSVPIKINLAPYFQEANASLPETFKGGDHPCSGVSYDYLFKRNPIRFNGVGKQLEYSVDGSYWMKTSYCPECLSIFTGSPNCITSRLYFSCGVNEPMRKMKVTFQSQIGVDANYRLASKTRLKQVKAITPCKVTLFRFDATSTLEKEVKKALKSVEKDIDAAISEIDLKPEMEYTWKALEEPIDLNGYGYMFMNPKAVGMSDIRYKGDTAYLEAYLEAYPKVRLDTAGFRFSPLPQLSDIKATNGFDVIMDISAQYDSLSAILTRDVRGMETEIKGKKIIFGDVKVYGAAESKLHIQVDFSGKKSGTLFLTGTPNFNAEKQHISFPDLEFDLKTKSALLKSAKWLFDNKITSMIREAAAMDLTNYLESFKGTVDESLNGELDEGVIMNGEVEKILIDFICPRKDALFIRVSSRGKLAIQM
jgi:hypothetical protein